MNEAQFDLLLESALKDAIKKDLRLLNKSSITAVYSHHHKRRMRKMCLDPFGYMKKQLRPTWKKILRSVACIFIIISISLSSIMAISPEARAWFSKVMAQWFDTFVGFSYLTDESDEGNEEWVPSWLPDGFYISQQNYIPEGISTTIIQSSDGQTVQLFYSQIREGISIQMDNESSEYQVISKDELRFYIFKGENSIDNNSVICVNEKENVTFTLISLVNINDLISIAENMKK